MLKISEFSTLSKITIHMLRNYDKIGLLTPAHVDVDSGYRYYSEGQLAVANRIQALKAMGLGLTSAKSWRFIVMVKAWPDICMHRQR